MRMWLVVYDISDDSLRLQLANVLLEAGLKRIQKSAFEGYLSSREFWNLANAVNSLQGIEDEKVAAYPLDDRREKRRVSIGKQEEAPMQSAYWLL